MNRMLLGLIPAVFVPLMLTATCLAANQDGASGGLLPGPLAVVAVIAVVGAVEFFLFKRKNKK